MPDDDKITKSVEVAKESKHKHKSKDKEKDRKKDKDRKREKGSKQSRHDRDDKRTEEDNRASPSAPTQQPSQVDSRSQIARSELPEDTEMVASAEEGAPLPSSAPTSVPAPETARVDRPQPTSALPRFEEVKAQITEAGGEVSMSIDETNRVRAALGLKPLKAESNNVKKEQEAGQAKRDEAEKAVKDAELRDRVQRARDKRQMEEGLAKVVNLGAAEAEVDDMAAWVARSRRGEEEAKRSAQRAAASRVASMYDEDDEQDSDADEAMVHADLVGMKVRHTADELGAGETAILTLADKGVLDEDDTDELENVLVAEDKKRSKARQAATKTGKPLFEEDGVARGLLEKYDEAAPDDGMQIDASGVVADERTRRQAEIRAKLAAAGESAAGTGGPATFSQAGGDFYTAEEMAQFVKPKKRRLKKKLRKKESEEDEAAAMASEIAALEVAAAAAEVGDHGSRSGRGAEKAQLEAQERLADLQKRQERYDRALEKANTATLEAGQLAAEGGIIGGEEEEDDMRSALDESVVRARRAAAASGPKGGAAIAEEVKARRQQDEEDLRKQGTINHSELAVSEAMEFTRTVGAPREHADVGDGGSTVGGGQEVEIKDEVMGDDEDDVKVEVPLPPPPPPMLPKARPTARRPAAGGWREEGDEAEPMEAEAASHPSGAAPSEQWEDSSVTQERAIGSGLAGALQLLKQRGELNQNQAVVWSGRNNDMKASSLKVVEDVFTGGRAEDRIANSIENALRRTDEFGRQMTPKEAYRELNYKFHGIEPSKNKKAKKQKKFAEEQAKLRAATSEAHGSLERLKQVQQASATPYLVLDGTVRPGQISDPASGYATSKKSVAHGQQTPALGGGLTPLTGDRKVEAMLGIKRQRPDSEAMPPPPARRK